MAENDKTTAEGLFRQMSAMVAVNPMIAPQAKHILQAQEKMLQDAEAFSEHWFKRRHAATRTALDAARDVASNGGSEPAAAIEVITDWQRHSIERITEDFREWVDLCMRCAGHVAGAEVEAEKEAVKKTAKQVTSASKAKHATPV